MPTVLEPAVLSTLLWELRLLLFSIISVTGVQGKIVNPSAEETITVQSWNWRYGLLLKLFLEYDDLYLLQSKHIQKAGA